MSESMTSPDEEAPKVDDEAPTKELDDVAGGMSGMDPLPANEGGGFAGPPDVTW